MLTTIACLAWAGSACAQQPPAADDGPKFEIKRFVYQGASLISRQTFDAATAEFIGPGKSFADVQRALEAVERLYSVNGWSAVQVLLPEQELERGEVRFQIIEATVGRVLLEGNKFFDEANIRASVPSLKPGSAPNINAIARNLRIANESASKQTTVLLRSGQQEATVDAVVRVVDESPYKSSITVDNSGTAQTGPLRVGFGFQNSNVNNSDHALTLQYVGGPYRNVGDNEEPTRLSLAAEQTRVRSWRGLPHPALLERRFARFHRGLFERQLGQCGEPVLDFRRGRPVRRALQQEPRSHRRLRASAGLFLGLSRLPQHRRARGWQHEPAGA